MKKEYYEKVIKLILDRAQKDLQQDEYEKLLEAINFYTWHTEIEIGQEQFKDQNLKNI